MEYLENNKKMVVLKYDDVIHLVSYTSNVARYDLKNNKLYLNIKKYRGEDVYKCSQATCKHLKQFINNYCQNLIEYKTIKQFDEDAKKNKNIFFINW